MKRTITERFNVRIHALGRRVQPLSRVFDMERDRITLDT